MSIQEKDSDSLRKNAGSLPPLLCYHWVMTPNYLTETKLLLSKHLDLNHYHAFIFGSRATHTNRPYSDIDIGIEGNQPLPPETRSKILTAFEDSNLPFFVDVVDFSTVTDQFKQIAKKHIITLN